MPGCGAACSARSRQRHGLLRYLGGRMRGVSGEQPARLLLGERPSLGAPRGEEGTLRPPCGPWVCPLRQRGGALRVTEPSRGGAGMVGEGSSLVPMGLWAPRWVCCIQPGTAEGHVEASVPCAVALT